MNRQWTVSVEEEIQNVSIGAPHVVLLGAGASRAAFPDGEATGRKLPLMADLMDIVPIGKILRGVENRPANRNFEALYGTMAANPAMAGVREELEAAVFDYFAALRLPERPTLYDLLLVSLRGKDVIATFNWDPFLILAARRSGLREDQIPRFVFLHGNVAAGFCTRDKVLGVSGGSCRRCQQPFEQMRLLFPVAEKDYDSDPMIRVEWLRLRKFLERPFWLTIFGYGAPKSDRSAMALLKEAWGRWQDRQFERVEVIDIRPVKQLEESWKPFIHTHHREFHKSFSESWLARHPRRTGEAYRNQFIEAKIVRDNSMPDFATLDELREWHRPLLEAEDAAKA